MSELGKHAPGLVGFPTPDAAVGTPAYLLFLFDDPTWGQWLLGALTALVSEYSWYKSGGLETWEASELFRLIVQQAPYNFTTSSEIDTPFWDEQSGDDASSEITPPEQPWYGVWDGETFIESLSYWAVTAFLATGVSEGAAIRFVTPLRTFRLTLKKSPHGAKLLVLMDSNLFQLVDLFSATDETVTVDVVSPGSTMMLVHSGEHNPDATPDGDGNYTIQVIKSRLDESDVLPSDIRYSGDPPVFQTTMDGGATWVDSPSADPRYNPANKFPGMSPYSGIECDAAARMSAQLRDTLNSFIASGDAAQFATDVLAIIAFPFGIVGWLLDIALFVANTLIDIGQANIETAFTTAVYDDVKCIFRCYVSDDGTITQYNLDLAYEDIKTAHPGIVASTIDTLRFLYTDVTMSNASVSRDETGDCSACDDCPPKAHQWTNIGTNSIVNPFTIVTFETTSLTPSVRFTKIHVDWTLRPNTGATLVSAYLTVELSGAVVATIALFSTSGTNDLVFDGSPQTGFRIEIHSCYDGGSNYPLLNVVCFEYAVNIITWVGGTVVANCS